MKKLLAIICLSAMLLTMLASCNKTDDPTVETTAPTKESTTEYVDPNAPVNTFEETVFFTSPAIKAENGKHYDLSLYNVEFTDGKATSSSEIEWSSEDIEIEDGKIVCPESSGVYKLNAKSSSGEKTVYLVSKADNETEYVLYYNDFEDADISDFDIIEQTGASAEIKSGRLILKANASTGSYLRLLFPEFLGDFGNYKITANATITSALNTKRWTSVMFRIQDNNFPYYQIAIRQNAAESNGLEIAERTKANAWSVRHKGPFKSALSPAQIYQFTADVFASSVTLSVNDELYVEGNSFGAYTVGRVGVQANGCIAEYEDIKVVLSAHDKTLSDTGIATPTVVNKDLIGTLAVAGHANSADVINGLSASGETVALATLDNSLNITDTNGKAILKISDFIKKLEGKVIPAFEVNDMSIAEKLCDFLKKNSVKDVMVLSKDSAILNKIHKLYSQINSIFDLRTLKPTSSSTWAQMAEIRESCNKANSRICLLPSDLATKENVEYLQRRATSAWFECDSSNIVDYLRCVAAGAYGVLASDTSLLMDAMGPKYFAANTILRMTEVIGHRGMPSQGPENTIESSILALKNGATIIENDIYLSKDGVVVVMHDSTIDRTTNGTGKVESFTYAELQKYNVDVYEGVSAKIPTLEDYFKEFKGKDVVLYIEIKTTNKAVIDATKVLIEKYDILDQCAFIAFKEDMALYARETIPGISCGYLTSDLSDVESILSAVQTYDTTFNPNKSLIYPDLIRALTLRGITVWPWTLNSSSEFDEALLAGATGITTNFANFSSKYLKSIKANAESYSFAKGASADIILTTTNYMGENATVKNAEMVFVSGNETVKYENGKLTATASGDAYVMFRFSFKVSTRQTVYITTGPILVSIK